MSSTISFGKITFVIPCYNEAKCLVGMLRELRVHILNLQAQWEFDYEIILVDDGSTDATWKLIEHESLGQTKLKGIRLLNNAGQQAALLCGYSHSRGDWVLTLDADLQDPPEVLADMLRAVQSGAEIVIARRKSRNIDSPLKRLTAFGFYRLMQLLGVSSEAMQAGDFRLMSRSAVDTLVKTSRPPLFHRFKVFELELPTVSVEYERAPRLAGDTKYSYRKMLVLAVQAAWSTRQTRRRLRVFCLAAQILIVSCVLAVAWQGGSLWAAGILAGLQLVLLCILLVPAVGYITASLGGSPCFCVAQRCESSHG